MADLIETVSLLGVYAIAGYFAYKVILPHLKDIKFPELPPIQYPPLPTFTPPPPPPQAYTPPATSPPPPPDDDAKEEKKSGPPPKKNTNTLPEASPPMPTASSAPQGATTTAGGGMTIGFKTTGQKVAMNVGGDPAGTGKRYNANHKFTNYLMSGLFLTGKGQELIEMKTDGPNHSGCSQVPKCFWAEPRFAMNGKPSLSMEMPHTPRKDYDISCPSCKSITGSFGGKWIGYAIAAYGPKGGRTVEQWVDPTGSGTKWQLTLREKIDARWHGAQNRDLPLDGRGLEAEIRMIGASSGTDMKNAFIYEIVPPASTTVNNIILQLLTPSKPRRYNNYYYHV